MAEELQYLDSLNSKNTLFLIRQPSTGRILTGRRVNPEQMAVYARIQQQEIPHVPYVRDIIQEADGQYLVLQDYIQGITLEQVLAERHFLTYPETAHIGVQICQALEGLHIFGIIHRDVKPANIMVTGDNNAYLIELSDKLTQVLNALNLIMLSVLLTSRLNVPFRNALWKNSLNSRWTRGMINQHS